MFFNDICIRLLWTKVASSLEGLMWLAGLICEYRVILKLLYMLKSTSFFIINRSIMNVYMEAITEKSEGLSITEAQIGLHPLTGNVLALFFISNFIKSMVASNMNFGYQMLTDLLEIWHRYIKVFLISISPTVIESESFNKHSERITFRIIERSKNLKKV